jgi:hypothetical protein
VELASFEHGSCLSGTEYGKAFIPEVICETGCKRNFRTDDHEAYGMGPEKGKKLPGGKACRRVEDGE